MKIPVRKISIIIGVTLVIGMALELFARSYLAAHPLTTSTAPMLYGIGIPAANEGTTVLWRPTFPEWVSHGDYLVPKDYASADVNYRDGYRVTVGQPTEHTHTVWMLGSSTMISVDLADDETISSQLQALMPNVRVMNVGMNGADSHQMVARLRDLPVERGDIVIFVSGSREAYGVFLQAQSDSGSRLTDGLCSVLLAHFDLGIIKLGCYQSQYDTPGLWDDRLQMYTNDQYGVYSESIARANVFTQERGATFVNVLTPFCSCMEFEDYHGINRALIAFIQTARLTPDIVDLSRVVPESDFYTQFHINAHGARIVAQALYDAIMDKSGK